MVLGLDLSEEPHDAANAHSNGITKDQYSNPLILYLKRKSEY